MKIRAKADFYGSIKMDKDETREIENDPVISDLLKMGLIEILCTATICPLRLSIASMVPSGAVAETTMSSPGVRTA